METSKVGPLVEGEAEKVRNCYAEVKLQPASSRLKESAEELSADVRVNMPAGDSVSGILIACKVFFCQDQDVCLFEEIYFKVPVGEAKAGLGGDEVPVSYALSPKAQTVDFPGQ